MNQDQKLTDLIIKDCQRRLFEESYPRIEKCIGELSTAEIWARPNENSNSVGNLILHLCGNVRQWVLSGIDEQEDVRQRQSEFDERGPVANEVLFEKLALLKADVNEAFARITPEKLCSEIEVQGFKESGISILIHIVEHFSFHVGQITYYTKMVKDMDLKYYGDLDLETKSN